MYASPGSSSHDASNSSELISPRLGVGLKSSSDADDTRLWGLIFSVTTATTQGQDKHERWITAEGTAGLILNITGRLNTRNGFEGENQRSTIRPFHSCVSPDFCGRGAGVGRVSLRTRPRTSSFSSETVTLKHTSSFSQEY